MTAQVSSPVPGIQSPSRAPSMPAPMPTFPRPTPLLGPHCQLPLLFGASRSLTLPFSPILPVPPTVVTSGFVVPPCRGRRELVSVVDSGAGFTVTRLSAYQVTNLAPGTKY